MPCSEFTDLLSAFHDGELPLDRKVAVADHVAACPACSAKLLTYQKLSGMAAYLNDSLPPANMWSNIDTKLNSQPAVFAQPAVKLQPWIASKVVATATLVAMIGIAFVAYMAWPMHGDHHVAVNLGPFIDIFERSPMEAQQHLRDTYSGQKTHISAAMTQLKYSPVVASGLPPEYAFEEASLLQMPCCRCLEACYRRAAGGVLCVFEHEQDDFVKFGEREVSAIDCGGKPTRVVDMDGRLAASWSRNGRFITVIGAQDVGEVTRLMRHFEQHDQVKR